MYNWNAILQLQAEIFKVVDASIPNKAQNNAMKDLIGRAVNDTMNRIAAGELTALKGAATGKPQVQNS